jgi:hypothetical protein
VSGVKEVVDSSLTVLFGWKGMKGCSEVFGGRVGCCPNEGYVVVLGNSRVVRMIYQVESMNGISLSDYPVGDSP